MGRCPRLVIAGTGSGVGKTSLALGLVRALSRHGLRVQTFKVGPDFLDPSYLTLASGRPCYNLDGWMTGRPYVQGLFARTTRDADIAIIEGVMGLFDGASPSSLEGSTAEIAAWLGAPVLLTVNTHGVARSLAAIVKGYAEFEPSVRLAGVIANQSGSERHKAWLAEALGSSKLPPLVGAIPRGALPALQSRHLGLVTADTQILPQETLDELAAACERHLDLDLLVRLAGSAGEGEGEAPAEPPSRVWDGSAGASPSPQSEVRIGIARDEAFHFYYPDNLELLAECGAELVEFSPIRDQCLPSGLAGIYLGGGYPEVHAEALSANQSFLADIRAFAASGRCLYAECGGLMYLGRALATLDGKRLALAGVVPIETAMLKSLRSLGYVEVTPMPGSIWSPGAEQPETTRPPEGGTPNEDRLKAGLQTNAPLSLRGHEFHYSRVTIDESAAEGWHPAYQVRRRRSPAAESDGFCKGAIVASYVHLHFASCQQAARHFVDRCRESLRGA